MNDDERWTSFPHWGLMFNHCNRHQGTSEAPQAAQGTHERLVATATLYTLYAIATTFNLYFQHHRQQVPWPQWGLSNITASLVSSPRLPHMSHAAQTLTCCGGC